MADRAPARPAVPVLDLRIEELVLHGFERVDRHQVASAIERELARLLREPAAHDRLRRREVPGGCHFLHQRFDVRAQELGRAVTLVANEVKVTRVAVRRLEARAALAEIHFARDAGLDHPLQGAVDGRTPDPWRIVTNEVAQVVGAQMAFLPQEGRQNPVTLAGMLAASRTRTDWVDRLAIHLSHGGR